MVFLVRHRQRSGNFGPDLQTQTEFSELSLGALDTMKSLRVGVVSGLQIFKSGKFLELATGYQPQFSTLNKLRREVLPQFDLQRGRGGVWS